MASCKDTSHASPDGRTWRSYFPNGDLWVFGYGSNGQKLMLPRSLIWKPPPHYDQRVPGYVNGYVRRFWQVGYSLLKRAFGYQFQAEKLTVLSTDHRGTPENPGRVVTVIERGFWETLNDPLAQLESSSAGRVWGAAYHIPASHAEEVHDYLDEREIDGYTVHYTPFYPFLGSKAAESESKPMTCMVYIGQPTNPQFLRDPARREPEDVAEVISRGWGQSGKNTEYLYLLEKALEGLGLGSADGYVTDLVQRVKAIEEDDEAARDEEAAERDLQKSLSRSEEEAHRAFQNEERV